ncbi:MAG: hypothetical protein GY940_02555, partial [bacterium]|nr:hypothetical protein [bacterium]
TPNDIRECHRELSRTYLDFIDYVERNPGMLNRSSFDEVYATPFHMVYPQPWPVFIDPPGRKKLEDAAREVFQLIKAIPQRLFGNDIGKMSRYYNIPEPDLQTLLAGATPQHIQNLLGRGDFVFTPSGYKCLEYNVTGSLGGWSIAFMEAQYLKPPLIVKFMRENNIEIRNESLFNILYRHLLDCASDTHPNAREINIGIAIPNYGSHSEEALQKVHLDKIYRETLTARGIQGEIMFGDFRDFAVKDNTVFSGDKQIHLLIEMTLGVVPPEIMDVFEAGNVLMFDGPAGILLSNKLNLALLSENQNSDVFSPRERELIEAHIPWTRKIIPGDTLYRTQTVDLQGFMLENKDKLVIKPADGTGGESVTVGQFTPAILWKEIIKIALRNKNWLVQEYVESNRYLFQTGDEGCAPHDMIWGVFIFGEQYAGAFLRVLAKEKNTKGVVNSHTKAEYSVLFEVDE